MDDLKNKILNDLKQKRKAELMKTVTKYGTLHPKFSAGDIPEEITQSTLQEVEDLSNEMSKNAYENNITPEKAKHPRFSSSITEETITGDKIPSSNLAQQLDDIGEQGKLLKNKLIQSGMNPEKIKNVPELTTPSRSTPYVIPMDERARFVDIAALKKADANKKALELIGKLGKAGMVLGAGTNAFRLGSDVADLNTPNAVIDATQLGLGLSTRAAAAPLAIAGELLRSTPTQTTEHEEQELAKYRRLNNMLTEQKKKNRVPASEE